MKNIAIRPAETKMMSVLLLLNGLRGSNPINELLLKKSKIFVLVLDIRKIRAYLRIHLYRNRPTP